MGYFFTNSFELELQAIDTGRFEVDGEILWDTTIEELTFDGQMLNGVFHFRETESFTPYVLAGLGRVKAKMKNTENINLDESETAVQLGLGGRLYFGKTRRGSLRFEVSALNHDLNAADERSTQISFTGGLSWRFGK